jgi:GTP-binding protein
MNGFVDETVIEVSSGHGGSGAVSFRREKYVPKGGPDGGDGGEGGNVRFVVREDLKTLSHLKMRRTFKAENGRPGGGSKKHGRKGRDVEIPVPPGTLIRDSETGHIIKDLCTDDTSWTFLEGGKGGKGNARFASSTRRTPRYAQKGEPGKTVQLKVELQIIADIGLVGMPNAGKSTLLRTLTNAHPEVGSYPFTTKTPHLGVLSIEYQNIVVADIPGLIRGASEGAGLGIRFLKHISRTSGLTFLIDIADPEYLDHFEILKRELAQFRSDLLEKKRIIVATKIDLDEGGERLRTLVSTYQEEDIVGVSSFTGEGIPSLEQKLLEIVR